MLYEHQETGAQVLAAAPTGRKYLGDEPGLGKTRTLIKALELREAKRPLVICPAIVRSHWLREFDEMEWFRHSQRPAVKSYEEIVIGGNGLMRDLIGEYKVDSLVVDEAHYLKHPMAKRTQQIFGVDGYARRLPVVLPASGTPIPKNPLEFWPVLATLFPEVAIEHGIRSTADFKERFCTIRQVWTRRALREKVMPEIRNVDEFRAILGKVMIARSLEEVGLDVPAIQWQLARIDPDVPRGDIPVDEGHVRAAIEANDLASIANDPHVARMRRRLGELKAPIVAKMLVDQLHDSTEKIVVYAHHKAVLDTLEAHLKPFGVARIDGDVLPKDRELARERFLFNIGTRVFLGQNMACQTGLDGLQIVAKRAVMAEPDWTATVNYQLGKRLARIGQEGDRVIVQMVALAGTLDEAIVKQNVKETRLVAELSLGKEIVMR